MTIEIELDSLLAASLGYRNRRWTADDGATVHELLVAVFCGAKAPGASGEVPPLLSAVNEQMVVDSHSHRLEDGDVLFVMTPLAGG